MNAQQTYDFEIWAKRENLCLDFSVIGRDKFYENDVTRLAAGAWVAALTGVTEQPQSVEQALKL